MLKQNRYLWLLWLTIPLFFLAVNEYYFRAVFPGNFPSDNRRIIELFILFSVGINLLLSFSLRHEWLNTFLQLPKLAKLSLCTFFAIGIISAAVAPLPKYAFLQVAWYVLLLVTALTISTLYRKSPETFRTILLTTIVSSLSCYCIYAVLQYAFELMNHANHPEQIYSMNMLAWPEFVNPRFLMQLISWTVPFMVIPMLLHRKALGYWVWACYAFASYLWCLDIANQSRIVPIQLIVVSLSILLIFRRQALPWLKQQLYVVSAGFGLYMLMFHVFLSSSSRDLINYADPYRHLLLKLAAKFASQHPLLGVGPMHFPYYAYAQEQFAAHPHNAIMLIAAEWGLVAMLCLFGLVIWGLWRWLKTMPQLTKSDTNTNLYAIALTASLLAAGIDAMVDGVAVMPLSQIMLTITPGLMYGMYLSYQPAKTRSVTSVMTWLLCVVILLSLAVVYNGIWPDILYLRENQIYFVSQCHTQCQLAPNFWTQGWIQLYGKVANLY